MAAFALRYARALDEIVVAHKLDRSAVGAQLSDFAGTLAESHDLHEFLMNPAIEHEKKIKVLDAIAGRLGMDPVVRNFVAVLMDHQRLLEIEEVIAEYVAVADAGAGTSEAEITSARGLREEDKQVLTAEAAKLAGGNVRVLWKEDASLLGGAVIRIGSTIYDGSVRAQLGQLERHLSGTGA